MNYSLYFLKGSCHCIGFFSVLITMQGTLLVHNIVYQYYGCKHDYCVYSNIGFNEKLSMLLSHKIGNGIHIFCTHIVFRQALERCFNATCWKCSCCMMYRALCHYGSICSCIVLVHIAVDLQGFSIHLFQQDRDIGPTIFSAAIKDVCMGRSSVYKISF